MKSQTNLPVKYVTLRYSLLYGEPGQEYLEVSAIMLYYIPGYVQAELSPCGQPHPFIHYVVTVVTTIAYLSKKKWSQSYSSRGGRGWSRNFSLYFFFLFPCKHHSSVNRDVSGHYRTQLVRTYGGYGRDFESFLQQ